MPEPLAAHPALRRVLAPNGPWSLLEHHREVTSTNDVALARLREGAATGLVVTADRQTAGRGRAGRVWTDVEGPRGPGSLAVTATAPVPAAGAGLIPLAAGVAVLAAFAGHGAHGALKWPNDVLLPPQPGEAPEAKAAGILVERHHLGTDRAVLLVGCGLDLDWRGVDRSGAAWTSLAEATGADVDRGRVLADLLASLGRWFEVVPEHSGDLVHAYRGACATLGRRVRASLPGGVSVEGVATDVDDAGALVVESADGPTTVSAGDVHHLRPA